MATENPMRIVDSGGAGTWAPPRGSAAFAKSATARVVVTDEMGLLLRGRNNVIDVDRSSIAPNRTGSAPPSMEGSFLAFGNNWGLPSSIDVHGSGASAYVLGGSLPTHEEEPEDDRSFNWAESNSSIMPGQNMLSFNSRHKSLVDLIQEDFPRTPSPVFNQNRSSSHAEEPVHRDMESLSLDSPSSKQPESRSGVGTSAAKTDISLESTDAKDPSGNSAKSLSPKKENLTSDGAYFASKLSDNQQNQGLGFDQQNELQYLQNTYPQHSPGGYHLPIPQAPMYAPNAAYGNSIYPNFNSPGLYPQYGGGYAVGSTYLPPYMAGYPPQTGGYPLPFSANNSGQRFSGQTAGIPTEFSAFPDPLSLQYFQQNVQNPYGVPVQYDYPTTTTAAYSDDRKYHFPASGSVGFPSNSYLSSPTGRGFMPRFPASPFGSPVMPQSPVGGCSPRGRYDFGFSQSSPRKPSFLEEMKASNARRIDLSEVVGRVVEFSIDQHGSRFIQHKLENCTVEEKELFFKEILPHCSKLITDVFGNYVIQKFFEHGTCEQRRGLARQLLGHMLHLSLQMYGCRVIQKALEVIEVEQKAELTLELHGHVMKCVRDQNGNHVLQKCIECLPTEKNDFIISAFKGQVATLATHPYGCRVIQRILEHCSSDLCCQSIVDEILESAYDLAHDQYGNYVTQHLLERGKPFERSQIIRKLYGSIVRMSHHKYASNVVEKCLGFGDAAERKLLIEEILLQNEDSNDNLLAMMKDQFANYVVQKVLEISEGKQREVLLDRIQLHLDALKKYTYGKHIVARFEQLRFEDNDGTSEA